jgi:N-acyl-D-aspartate/D-glutamate deacylase
VLAILWRLNVLDLIIRGGSVIDGTGSPRRGADVGIHEGRVAVVAEPGTLRDASRTIDATGLIVAPGFVDIHTHIDAQVFWDPALTPSCLHGVTSMMAGNCGFTLAPASPDSADYLVRMLSVVEGMPLEALQAGVPLDWNSTADYLDRLDGQLALNTAFMVGHSALRRVVMGPDGTKRQASADEITAMGKLLHAGLEAGGIGFSSSWGVAHYDSYGSPVPSRHAAADELVTLSGVCKGFDGTSLEFIPAALDAWDDEQRALLAAMSRAAESALNWNILRAGVRDQDEAWTSLEAGRYAREHGGEVVALLMPIPSRARFSFGTGFVLASLPGWAPVMALPRQERVEALRNRDVRQRLRDGAASAVGGLAEIGQWDTRVITQVFAPELAGYQGRQVGEIAREEGKEPFDALVDIVYADDLNTTFARPITYPSADDWRVMAEMWRDGRAVIGASDAGAHLDFTAYFDYPVYVIEHAVREFGVLTLEEAVHLMTQVPAELYGLRDRGRLAEGAWADIVVFDETTVASGTLETRFDLPAEAGRLYSEPVGIDTVLVNGVPVVRDGAVTGERPGALLRSGVDTADSARVPA